MHAAQPAAPLPNLPLLGRDWDTVAIPGVCPWCRGDGKHKGLVPGRCGLCYGSGKRYERRALTKLGELVPGAREMFVGYAQGPVRQVQL
jgi:hypothetical protein